VQLFKTEKWILVNLAIVKTTEASSSHKVCASSLSTGDQGGVPTLKVLQSLK